MMLRASHIPNLICVLRIILVAPIVVTLLSGDYRMALLLIFIAGFSGWAVLSVLSLFLATLSLVVVTKYDTQVFFLKIIAKKVIPEE